MFPLCTHHKQGKWEQSCSTELKCALGVPSRCSYYGALCSAFQSSEECVSERRTFAPFYRSAVQCIELIVFIWLLPEASSEQRWYSLLGLRKRVPTDGGKVDLASAACRGTQSKSSLYTKFRSPRYASANVEARRRRKLPKSETRRCECGPGRRAFSTNQTD